MVVAEDTIIVPVTPETVAMSPLNTLTPGSTFPVLNGSVIDVPVTGAVDVLVKKGLISTDEFEAVKNQ